MNKINSIPSIDLISSKLYDIVTNHTDNNNIKYNELTNIIEQYYQNIKDIENIKSEKNIYYNNNIHNPRILQNDLYNKYVEERQVVYDNWLNNKNTETTNNLAKFNIFDFKTIPDIYTYNFTINKNIGNKDYKIEAKDEIIQDIDDDNKCTDKKIEECRRKDKICNPKTGRCIKSEVKKEINIQEEPEKDIQEEPEKDIQEEPEKGIQEEPEKDIQEEPEKDIQEEPEKDDNKCTDKKIEECRKKDKICNPKTGRCNKK